MKIVRRKSDNAVLYLRPDSERVEIRDNGLWFGRARALDINAADHEVVEGPAPSQWYIGGMLAYDGAWSVVDEEAYREALDNDASYVATVQEQADKRAREIVLKDQIATKLDSLSDEDVEAVTYLYEPWTGDGEEVGVDTLRRFRGKLYKALQAHTTKPDWEPPFVPALWVRVRESGNEWFAGEEVSIGDERTYEGTTYRVIQAHTTQVGWEPPNVPALWEVV